MTNSLHKPRALSKESDFKMKTKIIGLLIFFFLQFEIATEEKFLKVLNYVNPDNLVPLWYSVMVIPCRNNFSQRGKISWSFELCNSG